MNLQKISSNSSQYYYQCLSCRDSFICPDWQIVKEGKVSSRVAVCPYCKSRQLDAFNVELPLEVLH